MGWDRGGCARDCKIFRHFAGWDEVVCLYNKGRGDRRRGYDRPCWSRACASVNERVIFRYSGGVGVTLRIRDRSAPSIL